MKKAIFLIFSISLLALFTPEQVVKNQESSNILALTSEMNVQHPIQPPVG